MARQARDGATYVRVQSGHSFVLWLIASLCTGIAAIIMIYYTISPNHYWHL